MKIKENKTLLVCPECASSDIQFMIWHNPNDLEIKAKDCETDDVFDGYCNSCEENIKHYNESEDADMEAQNEKFGKHKI